MPRTQKKKKTSSRQTKKTLSTYKYKYTKKKLLSKPSAKPSANPSANPSLNPSSNKFSARIILNFYNVGGGTANDKNSIKDIIENIGGVVEVVVYNDIKDQLKKKFKKVDIQIFIEHVFLVNPLEMFPATQSFIFINQEFISDWDINRMKDKTVIPLCKTYISLNTLFKIGIKDAKYVGFGNNKQFEYIDKIDKIPNLFIQIAGPSPLKGTITIIDTWIQKRIKHPLIITANNKFEGNIKLMNYWKSLKDKSKVKIVELPEPVLEKWEEWKALTHTTSILSLPRFEMIHPYSIYFCNAVLDYSIIEFLQCIAEIHLCPSLIEGWGQYIDEGRRSKSVVVTLDAPPMNELIKDNKSGVLVKAYNGLKMRQLLPRHWTQYSTKEEFYNKFLYGTYKTTPNDLYHSINRILSMTSEAKRKLGVNALIQSKEDYQNFRAKFGKVILDTLN